MSRIKTLIHVHTHYSFDSDLSLEGLASFLEDEGFGCVAVTDHDTIEGAKRLAKMTDVKVVVGEEVTTRQGHLIGLFLEKHVRPGMSARETAKAIHEQGGVVLLPHPFVKAFGCGLRDEAWRIADAVDAVEVFNAQNLLSGPDRRARDFAEQLSLPSYVGADSHRRSSIAPCYQIIPDFDGPKEFLSSLRDAERMVARHPLGYFAATAYRTLRYYLGLGLGGGFGAKALDNRDPACSPSTAPIAPAAACA